MVSPLEARNGQWCGPLCGQWSRTAEAELNFGELNFAELNFGELNFGELNFGELGGSYQEHLHLVQLGNAINLPVAWIISLQRPLNYLPFVDGLEPEFLQSRPL